MFDDIAAQFHENVVATYFAYVKTMNEDPYGISKDLRAALVSASALFHFREHLPRSNQKSRKEISKACPGFDLLGDIVNVSKHHKIDRNSPRITEAKDIFEEVVTVIYEDEQGKYNDTRKEVIARLNDGTRINLYHLLTEVLNFWGDELKRLKILNDFTSITPKETAGTRFLTREEAKSLNYELIRGVRYQKLLRILVFNQATGKAELMDLKGKEVEWGLRGPIDKVEVNLKNKKTGEVIKHTIHLSDSEIQELEDIESDSERKDFVARIAKANSEEISSFLSNHVNE